MGAEVGGPLLVAKDSRTAIGLPDPIVNAIGDKSRALMLRMKLCLKPYLCRE